MTRARSTPPRRAATRRPPQTARARRSTAAAGVLLASGLAAGLLWLGPAASPAGADRLVTHDGKTIATDGPWEVRGRLVVFTGEDGRLVSMRLSDVDLEASREATAAEAEEREEVERQAVEPPPEAPPRAPVLVLTDRDFTRRPPAPATAPGEEAGAGEGAEAEGDPAEDGEGAEGLAEAPDAADPQLSVVAWDQRSHPDEQHVILVGTLRNDARTVAASVSLEVTLFDEQGETLASVPATLSQTALQPGGVTGFRVEIPDVYHFTGLRFTPSRVSLEVRDDEAPGTPGGQDEPPRR